MGGLVAGNRTSDYQQIFNFLGNHTSKGYLKIPPCCGQDNNTTPVNKLREDTDGIIKPGLIHHIMFRQTVTTDYLTGLSGAQGHAKISQSGLFKPGHIFIQGGYCLENGITALYFRLCQIPDISAVFFKQMNHIQLGGIAFRREGAPGSADGDVLVKGN